MKKMMKTTINRLMTGLCAFALLISPVMPSAVACTTVAVGDSASRLVGKSYDWNLGHGTTFVNKRNVAKTALMLAPGFKPAQWTSKYGSVTFSQHGREFPLDGMNEAGLVVDIMWLNSAAYPHDKDLPAVNEIQWIQYQLDNFATVNEVIKALPTLQIVKTYAAVHYFVCDKTGDCASIEFIKQKPVVHHGQSLPVLTLTNNTYDTSVRDLKAFAGFGGRLPLPPGSTSVARFVRATALAKNFKNVDSAYNTAEVFSLLNNVTNHFHHSHSQWNLVYDQNNSKISFKTLVSHSIKSIDLSQLDFSCATPVLTFNMNTDAVGPVNSLFAPYSEEANLKLVRNGIGPIEKFLPKGLSAMIAHYPESTRCLP